MTEVTNQSNVDEITTEDKISQFQSLIRKMDLPDYRKSSDSPDNLKWLSKNIQVRNSSHPNFNEAMNTLVSILKDLNLLTKREMKLLEASLD